MHIVLVNPEIPQNTGSIARTAAATNFDLHLVGKLGFEIDEKRVRRAGLDYWPHVKLHQHKNFEDFMDKFTPRNLWAFTKFATKNYYEANFSENDALVFGSETKGLGQDFLSKIDDQYKLKIPMFNQNVRSLNLSNAVSIAVYESIRQVYREL